METQPIYTIQPRETVEPQRPGMFETNRKAIKFILSTLAGCLVFFAAVIGFIQLFVWNPTLVFRAFMGAALLGCSVMFARECKNATSVGWRVTGFALMALIFCIVANIWGVMP